MADQVSRGWHMPYCEIVGYIDACCGEVPTHIHIAATDTYCPDCGIGRIAYSATEGRPTAPVPFGYAICRHSSCCGEGPTCVHITATDLYCIDCVNPPTHTATEGGPTGAVPFGYAICRHSSCCGVATTHIHVAATDGYRTDK